MSGSDRMTVGLIATGIVFVGVIVFRFGPGFYRDLAEGTARRAGLQAPAPNPFTIIQVMGKWLSRVFGAFAVAGGLVLLCLTLLGLLGIGPFR